MFLFWCFAFVLMLCFCFDVLLLFWCFAFVLMFSFCFDFSFILGQIVMFKDGLKNVYLSLAPSCGPLCHSVGERREHIECAWCELYRNYIFFVKRKVFLSTFQNFINADFLLYQIRIPSQMWSAKKLWWRFVFGLAVSTHSDFAVFNKSSDFADSIKNFLACSFPSI